MKAEVVGAFLLKALPQTIVSFGYDRTLVSEEKAKAKDVYYDPEPLTYCAVKETRQKRSLVEIHDFIYMR